LPASRSRKSGFAPVGMTILRENEVLKKGAASAVPFGGSPGLLVRGSGLLSPRIRSVNKSRA
jgi:hypothetical protein